MLSAGTGRSRGLKSLPGPVPNYGGLAIRKGDTDFLNYLDTWIRVQQLHGWLDERKAYWFESDDWFEQIDKNPLKVK
jgi:ABC-type amino acid transport substrate-binding protein